MADINKINTVIRTVREVICDNSVSITPTKAGFAFVVTKNFSHSDADKIQDELESVLMFADIVAAIEVTEVSKTRSRVVGDVQFA
jgi:hypothetical protein